MKRYLIWLPLMALLGLGALGYGQVSLGSLETSPCPLAFDTNSTGSSIGGSASSLSSAAAKTGPNPYTTDILLQPVPGTGFPSGTPLQFSTGGTSLGTPSGNTQSGGINGFNPGSSISPGVTGGTIATNFGVTC